MNSDVLINLRRTALDPLAWQLSKRELHKLMKRQDLEGIIDATEDYQGLSFYARIHAVQVRSEILDLCKLVKDLSPKVIVEIGTFKGGTLFMWCRSNPRLEMIASIDLPGGEYGGGYDKRRARLYQEFVVDMPGCRMFLLQANSHHQSTVQKLQSVLKDRPIDFLYIDGDHTYEGVKLDYSIYAPLVAKSGLVAFHDISTRTRDCGVYRFWEELKKNRRTCEFVADSSNKGLGVILPD